MAACILLSKRGLTAHYKTKTGPSRTDWTGLHRVVLRFAPLLSIDFWALKTKCWVESEVTWVLCCNPSGIQFDCMTWPGCAACRCWGGKVCLDKVEGVMEGGGSKPGTLLSTVPIGSAPYSLLPPWLGPSCLIWANWHRPTSCHRLTVTVVF